MLLVLLERFAFSNPFIVVSIMFIVIVLTPTLACTFNLVLTLPRWFGASAQNECTIPGLERYS